MWIQHSEQSNNCINCVLAIVSEHICPHFPSKKSGLWVLWHSRETSFRYVGSSVTNASVINTNAHISVEKQWCENTQALLGIWRDSLLFSTPHLSFKLPFRADLWAAPPPSLFFPPPPRSPHTHSSGPHILSKHHQMAFIAVLRSAVLQSKTSQNSLLLNLSVLFPPFLSWSPSFVQFS